MRNAGQFIESAEHPPLKFHLDLRNDEYSVKVVSVLSTSHTEKKTSLRWFHFYLHSATRNHGARVCGHICVWKRSIKVWIEHAKRRSLIDIHTADVFIHFQYEFAEPLMALIAALIFIQGEFIKLDDDTEH